ncbi:MAG: ABC transporter substrate-binding protein [Pseudomonadota bacterium]
MALPALSLPLMRRAVLAFGLLLAAPLLVAQPAAAATPAESFVGDNIQKGLDILRDKKLSVVQRRDQFKALLLGLVDTRRIALYTLGQYRNTASPADIDAFAAAFQNYASAAYQTYFSKYTNQTLKVTGSTQRNPTDFIVHTQLIDPGSSQQPAAVDFRVRTDGGRPVLVDVAYEGVWLSLAQRDQFVNFLGQNNGNVRTLIAHLSDMAVNLGKP